MKIKKMNQYARAFSEEFYTNTPKAVFAALAASFLINFQQHKGCLDEPAAKEWELLFSQGIVPQKPPKLETI